VLLVARIADVETQRAAIEVLRFDHGQLSARTHQRDVEQAAEELARVPVPVSRATGATLTTPQPPRKRPWTAIALGTTGLAVAIVGVGVLASALFDYNDLDGSCGQAGVCPPSAWSGAQMRERAGYALVGIGGATAASGLIVWLAQRRSRR
jgi:hypothetical protein